MSAAADQWLESSARVLYEAPLDPTRAIDGLRKRLREAYLAGFVDGRKRDES